MKTLKLFVSFIAVFFTAFVGVFAQSVPTVPQVAPPSELSMIVSSATLRAYAISLAREVNVVLNSPSIVPGTTTYDSEVWTGSKTSLEITGKINDRKVKGETVNTRDTVNFYVSVNTADGDTLFYGYNEATPVQTNGVWALPASVKTIVMNLSHSITINLVKQITSADIVSTDSSGNVRFDQLAVSGSSLRFPSQSAGLANAYVRVKWTDGTSTSYTIASGAMRQAFALETSATSSFMNIKSFINQPTVVFKVVSVRGVGIVPLIEIFLVANGSVVFDIVTSEDKRPVKFWTKAKDGAVWSLHSTTLTVPTTTIPMTAGITYVIPEWIPSEFKEAPMAVATGGGGKG